ncbi:MAG: ABC transporter permease [Candidatus Aenigmarchaeota archaeon]|nr:ABC transporter permease [Candidatus Aenigmarchaeota archaeon]
MRFIKSLKYAANMVLHAKIRSWLTIIGIIIGVAAVISIVSLGQGLKQNLNSKLGSLGGDLLTLSPGASFAKNFHSGRFPKKEIATSKEEPELTDSDILVLRGIPDIAMIDAEISGRADVYFVAEKGYANIKGVNPLTWPKITTSQIKEGRMLSPSDTNVVVIGNSLADGFFKKKLGVNQLLSIEGKLFRIVGILDQRSTTIYMPINSAYEILDDKTKGKYDSIIMKVKDEDNIDNIVNATTLKLMLSRHVKTKDFTLYSNKETQQARSDMMNSLTIFLTAIAAVALLVGAIGIANTMFTSVLEKTKEIGIMKAIGARNWDILKIFLLKAGIIGFVGGLLGVVFGILLSGFLPTLMGDSGGMMSKFGSSNSTISFGTIILTLLISILIGMIAGVIPAYQASKLKPIDALKFE